MAIIPTKPQRGENALQGIYNAVCQIIDYLPSLVVRGDNKTISVNESKAGRTIRAIAGANPTSTAVPKKEEKEPDTYYAKITGAYEGGMGYYVSIYENGLDQTPTASTYKLYVPELAVYSTIPNGTIIIVHKTLLQTTGGND